MQGALQKYSNEYCFGYDPNYHEFNREKWAQLSDVKITFTDFYDFFSRFDGILTWRTDLKKWYYQYKARRLTFFSSDPKPADEFADGSDIPSRREHIGSLTGGLNFLFGKGTGFTGGLDDEDIKVYITNKTNGRDLAGPLAISLTKSGEVDSSKSADSVYIILDEYNRYFVAPPEPSLLDLLPDYLFLLYNEGNSDLSLRLVSKIGIYYGFRVRNGMVEAGALRDNTGNAKTELNDPGEFIFIKNIGTVDNTGKIAINYGGSGFSKGQILAVDFIDGKSIYDITYQINPVASLGFSKVGRGQIPSSILGGL